MRSMTSSEMREANGGRYRWKCYICGSKFSTKVAALIHSIFKHSYINIGRN